jgi:hypothetical protein
MGQMEKFLDEGVTPLQKYYDEMKSQFRLPSKNLMDFERKEFRKQLTVIRKAQKKELAHVKILAISKAKKLVEELIDTANITVKKEMSNIIRQFNEMSKALSEHDHETKKKDKMLKDQEKDIVDLRLSLFQSVTQQALDSQQLEKMQKYIYGNLSKAENDINGTIKEFLKKEKPIEDLLDNEPFLKNPFSFHSSYICLSLKDKEAVLKDDLVKYYIATIDELKSRLGIREKESKASSEMNTYFNTQLSQLTTALNERNQTIDNLQKDAEYDRKRHEKVIKDINKEFHKQKVQDTKDNSTGIRLIISEIQVREKIQQKMLSLEFSLKEEIHALKQILMVPRLHYKYLENKKLENIKMDREVIVKTEVKKIVDGMGQPHSTKNSYKSLSKPRHSNRSVKKDAFVNNFSFGNRNRNSSQFVIESKFSRSPSHCPTEKFPNILNKTTDSTITSMRSFKYDMSSPALDMFTIISTSNNGDIVDKRKNGNASQIEISKSNFM